MSILIGKECGYFHIWKSLSSLWTLCTSVKSSSWKERKFSNLNYFHFCVICCCIWNSLVTFLWFQQLLEKACIPNLPKDQVFNYFFGTPSKCDMLLKCLLRKVCLPYHFPVPSSSGAEQLQLPQSAGSTVGKTIKAVTCCVF